jgi:hypothetical protein
VVTDLTHGSLRVNLDPGRGRRMPELAVLGKSLRSHERPAAVATKYRLVPVLDPRVVGQRGLHLSLVFRLVPDRICVRLDVEGAK